MEDSILESAASAYIERRVGIMHPSSELWERQELRNIQQDWVKWWPRLEAVFTNRNMATCFLTNNGTMIEHGMYYDGSGKVVHLCCETSLTTGFAAKEVDKSDPAYGYTAVMDPEAGTGTVRGRVVDFVLEGPTEIFDQYISRLEVPGVAVTRNMSNPMSPYYKWHIIAVVIDAGAWTMDLYFVCADPADLDGSRVELQKVRATTPKWFGTKTLERSTEWDEKYRKYMSGLPGVAASITNMGSLEAAASAYIERRVKIMRPSSELWEREELRNVKKDWVEWWPRLEVAFMNRNMATCLLTNNGTMIEHGMYYDGSGKVVHLCCETSGSTRFAAKEVDKSDPAYGYTAVVDPEAGTGTVRGRVVDLVLEGPTEVFDQYISLREVRGAAVTRNMSNPMSPYYKWHIIAVVIDAGAWTMDLYFVCADPADLDGSRVELQKVRATTPKWFGSKTLERSTEWDVKYRQYMAGYSDGLKDIRQGDIHRQRERQARGSRRHGR